MSRHWADALRFAVMRLGLAPDTFWRLTLLEWRALAGAQAAEAGVLRRSELEALLARYPRLSRKEVTG
jgi:uncharacterized phage protein (TIGR02216 family)